MNEVVSPLPQLYSPLEFESSLRRGGYLENSVLSATTSLTWTSSSNASNSYCARTDGSNHAKACRSLRNFALTKMASRHREIETNEARYGRVVLRSTRGSFCHYPSKYKVSIEQNIDELKDQLYCANDEKSEAYIREQISEKIRELEQFSIEANEYRRKAVLCLYEKSTY